MTDKSAKLARAFARVIQVLWAGFWIFFVVGSAIGGGRKADVPAGESLKGILAVVAVVLLCSGAIYAAWRPPRVAGRASILIAMLAAAAFLAVGGPVGMLTVTALPPLVSGLLFLVGSKRLDPTLSRK